MEENQKTNKSFFKKYKIILYFVVFFIIIFIIIFFIFKNKQDVLQEKDLTKKQSFTLSDFFNNLFETKEKNFVAQNSKTVEKKEENNLENIYGEVEIERLNKIWDKPVSGFTFIYKNFLLPKLDENGLYNIHEENSSLFTLVYFVDAESGDVYKKDILKKDSLPEKIFSTNLKNTYKSYFLVNKNGALKNIYLQYLDEKKEILKTKVYRVEKNKLENLPDGIEEMTSSEDNTKIVYSLIKEDSSDWYLIDSDNNIYGKRIFSSPLKSWKFLISNDGEIYTYTKDSSYEKSSLYKLENKNKEFGLSSNFEKELKFVFGDYTGTSFLLKNNLLLISIFTNTGISLFTNNSFSGESFTEKNLYSLNNFKTLSNKCSLNDFPKIILICAVPEKIENKEFGLPDSWYLGQNNFDDNLYFIDTKNKEESSFMISNLKEESGQNMDLKNLKINKTSSHLVFQNKKNYSLWSFNLFFNVILK